MSFHREFYGFRKFVLETQIDQCENELKDFRPKHHKERKWNFCKTINKVSHFKRLFFNKLNQIPSVSNTHVLLLYIIRTTGQGYGSSSRER